MFLQHLKTVFSPFYSVSGAFLRLFARLAIQMDPLETFNRDFSGKQGELARCVGLVGR